jgi:Pyruvate/2-oxoacid:ferredoxin oxidoreductase delta subunit
MKEIVIVSGKGGTGKTVIAGSFAVLAKNKVMGDCDVDASNLYLLLHPEIKERHDFYAGVIPMVDLAKCTQCGICEQLCRFDAIKLSSEGALVDYISCEGCGLCGLACPEKAIEMKENRCGEWYISETRYGPLVYARLGIAEENSGILVTLVRKNAKEFADKLSSRYRIQIKTGNENKSGTDAKISIKLFGSKGTSSWYDVYSEPHPPLNIAIRHLGTFERGDTDNIYVNSSDLGEINKIQIKHDNTGEGPGWFISEILVEDLETHATWHARPNTWLEDNDTNKTFDLSSTP